MKHDYSFKTFISGLHAVSFFTGAALTAFILLFIYFTYAVVTCSVCSQ